MKVVAGRSGKPPEQRKTADDFWEANIWHWKCAPKTYDIRFKVQLILQEILKSHNRHNKSNLCTAMLDTDINSEYLLRMDNVQLLQLCTASIK